MPFLKRHTLKFKMAISFISLFIVVVITFSIIVSTAYIKDYKAMTLKYCTEIVGESVSKLDTYFAYIKTIVQVVGNDENIVKAVKFRARQEEIDYAQELWNQRIVGQTFQNAITYNPDIKDFIVVNHQGISLYYSGDAVHPCYNFKEQRWFPRIDDKYSKVEFIGMHKEDYYYKNSTADTISALVPIKDYKNLNEKLGASLICNLKVEDLDFLGQKSNSNMTIAVIDGKNYFWLIDRNDEMDIKDIQLKINNQKKGSFITGKRRQSYYVVYETSNITGWTIVGLTPLEEMYDTQSKIMELSIILVFLSILVVLVLSVILSRSITRPIDKMIKKFHIIGKGESNITIYDDSSIEIHELTKKIDEMIDNIMTLNQQVLEEQSRTKEAQIIALQRQINPHFFNNTLQSIKALAIEKDTDAISQMVTMLGKMMTYLTYFPNDLVTLGDELNYVENYMKINLYRYPNLFTYKFNISKDALNLIMPKLTLQPIIENAIKHGLIPQKHGYIHVQVDIISSDIIKIIIQDNGVGIEQNTLIKIIDSLKGQGAENTNSSIGLINVSQRIKYEYGMAYGLVIESTKHKGTKVSIILPNRIKLNDSEIGKV